MSTARHYRPSLAGTASRLAIAVFLFPVKLLLALVAPDHLAKDLKFLLTLVAYVAWVGWMFSDQAGRLLGIVPHTLLRAVAEKYHFPRDLWQSPRAVEACVVIGCGIFGLVSARVFLVPLWLFIANLYRREETLLRRGGRRMEDDR